MNLLTDLKEKIKVYFRDKPEVVAVYLFGSYAQGKPRKTSDLDLAILLEHQEQDLAQDKKKVYMLELARLLRKDIHPVILNSAGEELIRQIFLKGECLMVNDAQRLAWYKMVSLVKIAEFSFYQTRMQQGFIREIMKG